MRKLSPVEARIAAVLKGFDVVLTDSQVAAVALAARPIKEPSELDNITTAVLETCKWTHAMWGRAARTSKKLLAVGIKPDDIRLHYGAQDPGTGVWWWWRKGTDFRNKGLNAEIIAETCGQWEKAAPRATFTAMPSPTQSTMDQAQWLLSQMGD